MKKIYALLVLLAISVSALAQSGREIYNKYSDRKGVESVYISPAMFRMIGRIPDVEINDSDVNFSPIIKSMTGFYVLTCHYGSVADKLIADVEKYIKSGKYELMMEARDDDEKVRMYTVGDATTVSSFIMLSFDDDEVDFICFDGKMNRADMENLMAHAAVDD